MIAQALSEMAQEVHQNKGLQEVGNLLVPGVPYLANLRLNTPQDDRVPTWKAVQRLLQVW